MSAPAVTTRIERRPGGPVAHVVVENAARANCLSTSLVEGLRDAFRGLAGDESLRLAVLTGAGERAFVGGADLRELGAFDPEAARAYISLLSEANAAIRDLPVPVIARVNGACLGAGLEVAAACDLRIAAEHAVFGMPEVRFDIPSVVEAALLPRLVGWGRAAWLLYRGDAVDAATALAWGLVEKVVPAARLDAAVEECVEAILANGATGVRLQKALMRKWERLPLEEAIAAGIDSLAAAYREGRPERAIRAYFAGRRPGKRATGANRGEEAS